MKDSGIEWLGEIPEHWTVIKLKRIMKLLSGGILLNENIIMGNVPVYGSNGIIGYHNKSITKNPCIIIGNSGSFGKIKLSETECFPINTSFFIDETSTDSDIRWLYYILTTLDLDSFSKYVAIPHLNRDDTYDNIIPCPPINEQHDIGIYLNQKINKINTMIIKKENQIKLLQEHRVSLISEVMTGKIDVRNDVLSCISNPI
jgi:type I restriction enzyme S subunit